mgnify:CR=1 FL=1
MGMISVRLSFYLQKSLPFPQISFSVSFPRNRLIGQSSFYLSNLTFRSCPFFEMVAPLLPCRDDDVKPQKSSWLQGNKTHYSDTKESFFNTCVDFLPLLKFRWGPINPLKIMFETTRFLVCSNQRSCQPSKFVTQVPHRSLAPEPRNYVLKTKSINHYLFLTI